MPVETIELDSLIAWLQDTEAPVDLDRLVNEAARLLVQRERPHRAYAPGAQIQVGDRIWYRGELADAVAKRHGGNPKQGSFAIVDLRFPDGHLESVVAEARDLPQVVPSPSVPDEAIEQLVEEWGADLREALLADERIAAALASAEPRRPRRRCVTSSPLFAETILADELPSGPGFEDGAARRRFNRCQLVWQRVLGRCAENSETQVAARSMWRSCVEPIIEMLGWSVVSLTDTPIVALYTDPAEARAAKMAEDEGGWAAPPAALLITVPCDRPLAGTDATSDGSSAAARIVERLLAGDADWGIVTNGRFWRLYHASWGDANIGSTASEFHEIDLTPIFGLLPPEGEPRAAHWERFRRWWWLFSAASYRHDPEGQLLIERLKRSSADYAHRVVGEIRSRLLTSVLPEVAGGIITFRYRERGIRRETEPALHDIAQASLILIYRLIFILYAEAHQLLPVWNPEFRGQSLTTMLRWAVETLNTGMPLSSSVRTTPRYDALLALFRNLEHGHPSLGLLSHAGGLFSPVNPGYAFLERHRLSDRVVARTLAALGRLDGELIDYGALTMRHLSSVGEGLLDNVLWVVEASAGQVAFVNEDGRLDEVDNNPVPEYVGVSTAERALAAVMAARGKLFAAAMDRVAQLQRTRTPGAPVSAALAAAQRDAYDSLMGVKVLDPAMGAGRFLVCAIDVLVDSALREVAAYHRARPRVPWSWNPVVTALQEMREALREEADERGVLLDSRLLDDDVLLARFFAEHAVYGVDINPQAVELGEANLRMRAFGAGTPFVFLPSHLRSGDSLKGARLMELTSMGLKPPLTLKPGFSLSSPTDAQAGVLSSFEVVCDLVAGRSLESGDVASLANEIDEEVLMALRGEVPMDEKADALMNEATAFRKRHRFVHWDVLFPDVFLGADNAEDDGMHAGFDAIIGNPPSGAAAEAVEIGAGDAHQALTAMEQGPFVELARELVRRPGGRIAVVLNPSSASERSVVGGSDPR